MIVYLFLLLLFVVYCPVLYPGLFCFCFKE